MMGIKVIIENTDVNRSLEVFHNPADGWSTNITPGARVGCHFTDEQELVIRRSCSMSDLTPAPVEVAPEAAAPLVFGEE